MLSALSRPKVVFVGAFVACFGVAVIFVRAMELAGRFDSVGLWYTVYVSATFAVFSASGVTIVFWLLARYRARHSASGN